MRLDACAYHEAGHAVVGHLLGHKLKRIHIGFCGGNTHFQRPFQSDEHAEQITLIAYAGGAAQNFFDEASVRSSHTRNDHALIARLELEGEIEPSRRIELKAGAGSLVAQHWKAIETLAEALLKQKGACSVPTSFAQRRRRVEFLKAIQEAGEVTLPPLEPLSIMKVNGMQLNLTRCAAKRDHSECAR